MAYNAESKFVMTEQSPPKANQRLAEYLRVNHAGERAAQTIYKGQLAVLRGHPQAAEIQHMMEQEQEHLDTFDTLLNDYKVRPSLLDHYGELLASCWAQQRQLWARRPPWPAQSLLKKSLVHIMTVKCRT